MIYVKLLVDLVIGQAHHLAGLEVIPLDDVRARSLIKLGHAVEVDRTTVVAQASLPVGETTTRSVVRRKAIQRPRRSGSESE
jgi:hypothetical protein